MRTRNVTAIVLLTGILGGAVWWHLTRHGVNSGALLKRSDLSGTSVSYSWTGGFGGGDVRATISGRGSASLQIGSNQPILVKITEERYRELIRSLATNDFNQMRVQRRWGTYLHDIGRYEIVLADGMRRTVVYADQKHYIAKPALLSPIMEQIYSFEKEFGQRLDYGPFGMAGTRDVSELVVCAVVTGGALVGLLLLMFQRRRKRHSAEQNAAPNGGPATPLANSEATEGPPSVS